MHKKGVEAPVGLDKLLWQNQSKMGIWEVYTEAKFKNKLKII